MKFGLLWRVLAIALLGCAMLWAISFLDRIPLRQIVALMGVQSSTTEEEHPAPDTKLSLSDVAVQTFSGPLLVRQGSGTVVAADGLILTTTSVAPYGSGSFTYQVATPGRILRARRLTSDPLIGLVLLKVEAGDLNAVLFEPSSLVVSGMSIQATAATFVFSKFTSVHLPVWITWTDTEGSVGLSADNSYGAIIAGARLMSEDGRSVGIFNWVGRPIFIGATKINGFLERHLLKEAK